MTSAIKQRRGIVCRPPKYPGRPEDYVYVKEYCRSKTRESGRKSKITVKVSAQPRALVTEQDLLMRDAAQRLQEMPEFIAFAQQHLRGALLVGGDVDKEFNHVLRAWRGRVDFSRDAAVRRCVTAVFRS